jgi:serine/threonine protein kinase
MLFELCHPSFGTGMERVVVFENLKHQILPPDWSAAKTNPAVVELMLTMLNKDPSKRPDAQQVVRSILSFQAPGPLVLSLDSDRSNSSSKIVLRVEVDLEVITLKQKQQLKVATSPPPLSLSSSSSSAFSMVVLPPVTIPDPSTEALQQIRAKIMSAASNARIEQYGLRESANNKAAVMEFLLSNLDQRTSSLVSAAVTSLEFVRDVGIV